MQLETVAPATFFTLVPWVVLFPLIGLLINLVIGRKLGEKVVGTIASAGIRVGICDCLSAVHFPSRPSGSIYPPFC